MVQECRERLQPVSVMLDNGQCEPAKAGGGAAADLTELFGLTAAEARVACMIAEGGSIAEISDRLSVSELTARTHLKRIFGKTGTKRQSALVRLVLSMPNQHHKK